MRRARTPRRHRRGRAVALVAAAAVLAAGCGSDDEPPPALPTSTTTAADGPDALLGRTFVGDDVHRDGEPVDLVEGTALRLVLAPDASFGGSGGCNRLSGELDADALAAGTLRATGPVAMTQMACFPDGLMAQDALLASLLEEGAAWTLDGDDLELVGGALEVHLVDERTTVEDLPLVGTAWTVETVLEGDAASVAPADVAAVLVLHEDGTAELETGCNEGRGTWTLDGDRLDLGAMAVTERGCVDPAAALEAAVLPVLGGGVVTVEIAGDRLTVTGDGRGLVLRGAALVGDPPAAPSSVPGGPDSP